jgi:hypothetical protein
MDSSTASSRPELPWTLNRVDESERRIYLTTQNFGCSDPDGVSVIENRQSITITVRGTPATGLCAQQLTTIQTFVQLSNPISGKVILGNG